MHSSFQRPVSKYEQSVGDMPHLVAVAVSASFGTRIHMKALTFISAMFQSPELRGARCQDIRVVNNQVQRIFVKQSYLKQAHIYFSNNPHISPSATYPILYHTPTTPPALLRTHLKPPRATAHQPPTTSRTPNSQQQRTAPPYTLATMHPAA